MEGAMEGDAPRVAVVGAGVNGIGCALALLEAFPGVDLTIYADAATPHTTGCGSAGLWTPFIVGGTSDANVAKWSKATFDLYASWHRSRDEAVLLLPIVMVDRKDVPTPHWSHIPIDFRPLSQRELEEFGPEYIDGHTYSAYVAPPALFLPKLMSKVTSLGGKFRQRKVRLLEDLHDRADVIVNCAGIGSRDIVPDPDVFPIRGQVMRVKAPWIRRCLFDDSDENYAYIIPNPGSVVLGGTHQAHDWRTSIDPSDSEVIRSNCLKLEPRLKGADVLRDWAGLRPARKGGVRLEEDLLCVNGKKIPVVHNYGHGGSGATLFWGCSLEVRSLVGGILRRGGFAPPERRSKL